MPPLRFSDLSPEEQRELELRFDGPIPQSAVDDLVALRKSRAEALREKIRLALAMAADYLADVDLARAQGRYWFVDYYNTRAMGQLTAADRYEKELEALLAAGQQAAAAE